jgi:hypothetical protein
MNFDRFRHAGEARLFNVDLIDPVRQALHIEIAQIAGRQSISILIGPADDLNHRFHAEAVGVSYPETQFTAIALAKERHSAKEENSCESRHERSAFVV